MKPPQRSASRSEYERFWFGPGSTRWVLAPLAVAAIAGILWLIAWLLAAPASASVQACPSGSTCLPVLLITDGAKGMGAPLLIEDNEGHPPGQNAVMFWVDGFQAGSVNPVCSVAVFPYLQREACLGGPPFDATGGHPVVSLWDGTRWQVLTARDIAWLHRAEQLRPNW